MPKRHQHLRLQDRHTISALRKQGMNLKEIGEEIGFDATAIGREIRRNSGERGYRPVQAHKRALERRENSRRKRVLNGDMEAEVEGGIKKFHSPEQISGRLKKRGFQAPGHQTIYEHIVRDRKAGGSLYRSLRHRGKGYRRKHTKAASRGKIAERTGLLLRTVSLMGERWRGERERLAPAIFSKRDGVHGC